MSSPTDRRRLVVEIATKIVSTQMATGEVPRERKAVAAAMQRAVATATQLVDTGVPFILS